MLLRPAHIVSGIMSLVNSGTSYCVDVCAALGSCRQRHITSSTTEKRYHCALAPLSVTDAAVLFLAADVGMIVTPLSTGCKHAPLQLS